MKNPILRFNPILFLVITVLLTSFFGWMRMGIIALMLFFGGMQISIALLLYHTWTYIRIRQYIKLLLMYICFAGLSSGYIYYALKVIEADLARTTALALGTFTMEKSKADSLFMCEYDIISSRKINLLDSVGTELKYAYIERSISSDSNYFVNIITSNYMKGSQEWWDFNEPGVIRQTADHNNPENKDCKIYKIYRKQLPPDTISFYMERIDDNSTLKDSTTVANDVLDSIVIVKKQ